MPVITEPCAWRSTLWACCSSSRPRASVVAARSIRTTSRAVGGPASAMISRPQSSPRAPTTVTSQLDDSSKAVRSSGRTARDRVSQLVSSAVGSVPAVSAASTWWARFSSTTGCPARRTTWRSTSTGGAPSTDSWVNTSCSFSEVRSSASWASMIWACTASVTSTNGVSRAQAMSGRPYSSAAATRAGGSVRAYLRPSSTIRPLAPTSASSETYVRSRSGSSGSAMPVVSTSSPPRRRCAMSVTSALCTQRTRASRRSAPATTRGSPRRTASRRSTSARVGSTLVMV